MKDKFTEVYNKIIKESFDSYDDAKFMANVNADLYNNRVSSAKKIEEKYGVEEIEKKCPICGKTTKVKRPKINMYSGDYSQKQKSRWDYETWSKGLTKEEKILYRTGKCYDCQRNEKVPNANDVDPEV